MTDYMKSWLTVGEQIQLLMDRGVSIDDEQRAATVLKAIGYYRLTGYLYPFLQSEQYQDAEGRTQLRILNQYQPGTTLQHAEEIIDFDRQLRMHILEGIERIEIAARMRIGYILGCNDPYAHERDVNFIEKFTAQHTDTRWPAPSKHVMWLQGVNKRKEDADERLVKQFEDNGDNRIPIWVLCEILELGQLSNLYRNLTQELADEIANSFGVPTKYLMASWLASLNYARNLTAHHARLFNRKLQNAPARPKLGQVPPLDHLRKLHTAKSNFGTYNVLAVIAYLLPFIDPNIEWASRTCALLRGFPTSQFVSVESLGVPQDWESYELWQPYLQEPPISH
ncbi:MAG: Abi family protein [Corynebacterium sp.]|nr:Abi family protein [Corynebacterium sp.]